MRSDGIIPLLSRIAHFQSEEKPAEKIMALLQEILLGTQVFNE
jgi:hypothetical protein